MGRKSKYRVEQKIEAVKDYKIVKRSSDRITSDPTIVSKCWGFLY